jgi:hypothetical protein
VSARPALPDVVIGGAPRSGTTFLAELLGKHPGVFLARPVAPEPKVCLREHPDGMAGYLAGYARYFGPAPDGSLRVEKTTNYFETDAARERLARVLPETRFLFILREPVARAYSNWKWSTKNGLETLPFEQAVALEGQRPNPLGPEREAVRPFDYMLRGRYGSFATAWYASFGRNRIHFCLFEDAVRDPAGFILALQRWLGVAPLPWAALETGRVNATSDDVAGLDPALAARLRAEIRPEVEAFARLSGLDLAAWQPPGAVEGQRI